LTVFILIVSAFLVYLCNGRPHAESDCVPAPYTAWAVIRHGSFDLRPYPELKHYLGSCIVTSSSGAWVTMYPPGTALLAVPFVAPLALFYEKPPSGNTMLQIGKLAAALSVACATGLFYLICRRLAPKAVWPSTLLFAFGTCLFSVASQALWMHGPATLWLCVALYFLTLEEVSMKQAAFAGLALGLAVLTRPTTAFFAAATVFVLLGQRRWKTFWGLAAGGALPLVILIALNWIEFGSPVNGGYAQMGTHPTPPLWLGLSGLLVAPSRGVLVYTPAFLLLPLGIWQIIRSRNTSGSSSCTLVTGWLLASIATLLFYAHWWCWSGEWSYGPRYLCETMPVLCLVFALGYERLHALWSRRLAWGLIALSIMIHLVGIFGHKGDGPWHERHPQPDMSLCLFEFHDTQIGQHVLSVIEEFTRSHKKKQS